MNTIEHQTAGPAAPDLSCSPPRPMDALLEGYAWLPRMIDKARACRAGTLGNFLYPCPIDRTCLRGLGLDAAAFSRIASTIGDDHAILGELRRLGIPSAEAARFDPVALEHALQHGADA